MQLAETSVFRHCHYNMTIRTTWYLHVSHVDCTSPWAVVTVPAAPTLSANKALRLTLPRKSQLYRAAAHELIDNYASAHDHKAAYLRQLPMSLKCPRLAVECTGHYM